MPCNAELSSADEQNVAAALQTPPYSRRLAITVFEWKYTEPGCAPRPQSMSPEERIRSLSEGIIACKDEGQLLALTQQLQVAIHEHIESLRGQLLKVPAIIEKNIEAA